MKFIMTLRKDIAYDLGRRKRGELKPYQYLSRQQLYLV